MIFVRRQLRKLAVALALAAATTAHAQPVRTWGGERTPPEPSDAPPAPTAPPAPPPPPPPTTVGTPVEGSSRSDPPKPPAPAKDPDARDSEPVPPNPTSEEEEEARSQAIVHMPGHVGLRYRLEGVEVQGNTTTLSRVVLRYVRFKAGDTLDVDDKDLSVTRFRLLGTGFFRDVQLSLRRGSRRGYAVLVVSVVERNTIVVNDLWLGLSADAEPDGRARPLTAYGGLDVSERNLAGTGVTLGGAIALADRQLALRTRFSDPQFRGTPWMANVELLYNNAKDFFGNRDALVDDPTAEVRQDFAVASYRRFGGSVGVGHDLGSSTQLFLDYRFEKIDANLPRAASHVRGRDVEPIDFHIHGGSSLISTLRATMVHDTRDEPFLPTRGTFMSLLSELSLSPLGTDYPYAKLQVRASHWFPLSWGHVLRLEGFAGSIFGDAPLFERFYVGDFTDLLPDRVLDLNFDRRAAPNFLDTSIQEIRYGTYAAKVSVEYRIPLYRGTRSIYGIDLFGSVGLYGLTDDLNLRQPPSGYSGFSKVPIDLTFNAGLRIETNVGGFAFGIANLVGFIPVRSEGN
ncbi:BamA/TamA family outer membrane protein [Pendulispora rubella]|uniref:BamA/TamA family outer membrane protein n=1 Tax=Pendulispora rubella TaxID=2741070 RepID=A0ABZ2LKJ3_9BACT